MYIENVPPYQNRKNFVTLGHKTHYSKFR